MIINFEQNTHTLWHSDCNAEYAPPMKEISIRSTTSHPNIVERLAECTACGKQGLYPRGRSGPIDVKEHLGETNKMSKQRVVVCAAIRSDDGEVVCGVRHYDQIMQIGIASMMCPEDFYTRSGSDQGFVDNFGKYMDRKEALVVALKADQVIKKHNPKRELCSDDIY